MKMAYGNQICMTHAQNLLFSSFRSNSDIAVGFVDPDFLYGMDILAIDGYLPCDLDL